MFRLVLAAFFVIAVFAATAATADAIKILRFGNGPRVLILDETLRCDGTESTLIFVRTLVSRQLVGSGNADLELLWGGTPLENSDWYAPGSAGLLVFRVTPISMNSRGEWNLYTTTSPHAAAYLPCQQ